MRVAFRRGRRGANAVEFALTLPIFIALTFGMIEFGWYFTRLAQVNSSLLDGCRKGSLMDQNRGTGLPVTTAQTEIAARLADFGMSCQSCTASVSGSVPTKVVKCTVIIEHAPLTGALGGIMPTQIRRDIEAVLEWQREGV